MSGEGIELNGQRVEIVDSNSPDLYKEGSKGIVVGRVITSVYDHAELWYVKFDEGQEGVNYSGNNLYLTDYGEDCKGVWIVDINGGEGRIIFEEKKEEVRGEKEWIPDEAREDVMDLTREMFK